MEECASFNELPSFRCALHRSWHGSTVLVDDHLARPVRPRRHTRRMVPPAPAGHQDRPGRRHRAGIVPAAVSERDASHQPAGGRPAATRPARGQGLQTARHSPSPMPPAAPACWSRHKSQRRGLPPAVQKIIAEWRNRIEATFGEITDLMKLAPGAHSIWGLLTRTAAAIVARTVLRVCLAGLARAQINAHKAPQAWCRRLGGRAVCPLPHRASGWVHQRRTAPYRRRCAPSSSTVPVTSGEQVWAWLPVRSGPRDIRVIGVFAACTASKPIARCLTWCSLDQLTLPGSTR
jgi:hypothetical protein